MVGIPPEVTLYHPIEFLELDKPTQAFLNFSLEKEKGGLSHQLLVGHVVHFVQQNGFETFRSFPNFKENYIYSLIDSLTQKGISQDDVKDRKYNLNWDKALTLSSSAMVYKPADVFDQAANIYSSSNYSLFHFLPFNRSVVRGHVNDLVESMKLNGILSYPLMIYTDAVDGSWKYWIIDGQHRFMAFRRLGLPIWFTLYQKNGEKSPSMYDLVKLIADVNNTSKRWVIKQYLNAWTSLGVEEYQIVAKMQQKTELPLSVILEAYSSFQRTKAIEMFQSGTFRINTKEEGTANLMYLAEFKKLLPKNSTLYTGFLFFLKNNPNYNRENLKRKIKTIQSTAWSNTKELVAEQLQEIYNT